MKKILLNIVLILGVLYGSLFTLGFVFEIYDVLRDPSEYASIYSLSDNGLHWQFKSINNLIAWNILSIIFYGGYATLNWVGYKKKRRSILILVALLNLLIVILSIRFYLLLVESGYDHYPGFDPYLF